MATASTNGSRERVTREVDHVAERESRFPCLGVRVPTSLDGSLGVFRQFSGVPRLERCGQSPPGAFPKEDEGPDRSGRDGKDILRAHRTLFDAGGLVMIVREARPSVGPSPRTGASPRPAGLDRCGRRNDRSPLHASLGFEKPLEEAPINRQWFQVRR